MKLYKLFSPLFLFTLSVNTFVFPADILTNGSTIAMTGCKKHMVHDGDTCFSITRANNITYAQILAWNNNIKLACA